jgi:glycosyltransferase involved in cell wall biosynthesis
MIRNKFLLSIIRIIVSYIYKFSDLILIQSENFRPSVEALNKNKGKIYFHPNSSAEILKKEPSQTRISELSKDISQNFSIIFAGNIGASQSCETIIKAADLLKQFPNIKFYLVGEGRMAKVIAEEIKRQNLDHVIMTGAIPTHDMAYIYESASALLLTLRDDHGLSMTIPSRLQSYMAAGKPIIVSSNGASSDIIKDANAGISCPAGDAKTLAEAILTLYKMPYEKRNFLGKNGHTYFMRHFYLPQRTQDLIEHFKNLMKTKG